jgi:hypothetical protein
LERIGINIDSDLDCYIGDPEYESVAQITIDPDYDPYIEDEYY